MNRRSLLPAAAGLWAASASALSAAPRTAAPRTAAPLRQVQAADGLPISVSDWGLGPVVVFVHAWALSSRMWDQQVAALVPAGFRCVTFDRRGHGRTPDPGQGYDLDTLAGDLEAVLEQMDLRDVTLVGHSMGAAEALRFMGRPSARRVSRLFLLAPATPCLMQGPDNPQGVPAAAFEQVRAAWRRDFPKWAGDNAPAFYTPTTSPETVAHGIAMMLETPLQVAIACNLTLTQADLRPDCARIRTPTLVMQGDRDMSAPLDFTGRRTAALIPGARLEVVPGAPHGLFTTHADLVSAAIGTFAKAG